ncbi:hypothetical protein [Salipiger mucosus]|uniref:hypothetical protein n=1 Tax=Salipiger mucosus TaxID=263378 RepID=UPI00037D9E62|nr:hypothetical protein [Salipiger mucosus]
MKFYRLILTTAVLTTLGTFASARDARCVDVFQGHRSYPQADVRLVPVTTDVVYDSSLERGQLAELSDGRIARHPDTMVNGLTVANLTSEIRGNFRMARMGDGTTCVWPSDLEVSLGYDSITVYIAREFRPNTCRYDVTMEHENTHVDINRRVLNSHAASIRESIFRSVRRRFPRSYTGSTSVVSRAIRTLKDDITPRIQAMVREREAQHGELDSPESYAYWQSLCDRW